MAKLSKRERSEAAVTRRLLLMGGGALGLTLGIGGYVMSRPTPVPELSPGMTIGTRLTQIGPTPHHQVLTGSVPDLLVISDTGCAFCRDFVRTGLDPLIRFAQERGLSAAYLSVGYGRSGLISTVAAACMERSPNRLSGRDRVRALFEMTESGVEPGVGLAELISPNAPALGGSRSAMDACVPEEALLFRDRFEATRRLFELERTPTFFIAVPGDPGRVRKIEGFTSASAMTRRLARALTHEGGA